MPRRVGPAAVFRSFVVVWVTLGCAGAAAAQDARDCSGTLCDLYYGGSAPETSDAPAKKGAPTPLTVPGSGLLRRMFGGDTGTQTGQSTGQGATPGKKPLVGVGGGGLAAMARGEPAQRCSGTLCDMFYGGPAPETPAGANPAAPREAAAETVRDTPPVQAPATADPDLPVYRAPPRCAATGRDPWSCYR